MKVKIPGLVKKVYPSRIWDGPKNGKSLYLTFDDGPIPEITPWVLEELRKFDARATFFCIGDNVRKHPEVFRQVITEGHAVGNHTFNHLNGWKTSSQKYLENSLQAQQQMEQAASEEVLKDQLFRPPYGKIREKQARLLRKHGFKIVMWDIISEDYNQHLSEEKCLQNVLENAVSGSIVVFHDSIKAEKNLKFTLPKVLKHFKERGYTFSPLP